MSSEQGPAQILSAQQPLISFIVPVWNLPEGMLAQCIGSIMDLSLRPDERQIIVVDDGSDTDVLNEIAPWKDSIFYLRQPHAGLSVARNNGMALAQGKMIQFVDGDDLLLKQPYDHCIELARERDAEVVVFDFASKTEVSDNYSDSDVISGAHYMAQNNIHGSACSYLFSAKLRGMLQFTPHIFHEDEEFTPLLLVSAERLVVTSAQAYYYRQRTSSIVHQADKASIEKRLDDAEAIIFRLNHKAQTLPLNLRVALERRVAQLTMDLLYNTITTTHSWKRLQATTERLRAKGLFPLPAKHYTQKYWLFAQLTRRTAGRFLAHALLSLKS